ncbi:M10 family metallopeptidase C-terminal domain-containing protein [uncultured Methylobacterium sp.]|uniref:M10 family metallopeptidase C-terminal domain-containing protein n=1 Tax=uncultured Methylobacterium sp. TaxID=157278 RepID=UPI002622BF5A|nr:M10 family metallopeptidase C-terminal domain-containing protein [uncultured Methylobacterium sp.]
MTWFHEIGHALGLKHTHDDEGGFFPKLPGVSWPGDQGTTYLNSQISTVMGYTYSFLGEDNPFTAEIDFGTGVNAQPGSFGAIDIAALQFLYGAREHNTGDDTYRFGDDVDANRGYTTIWDTGGTDTIAYTGTSRAKIDLRAATLRNEIGGGGWISTSEMLTGGFTIANGVTIENASGNLGDDILIGNDLGNLLSGLDGNDRLDGGRGTDTLVGGFGDDTYLVDEAGDLVTERAGEGFDTVLTSLTGYTLGDDVEALTYTGSRSFTGTGNDLANLITGGDRADRLNGKAGADTMVGGRGNDTYVVDNASDVVVERAGEGIDRVLTGVSYTLGDNVENLGMGTSASLSGTGNGLANLLVGNKGHNVLDGRGGADTLTGGLGRDTFVLRAGETVGDTITDFVRGTDTLAFYGFGTDAVLSHGAGSDLYTVTSGDGLTSGSFRLTGVGDLSLAAGAGNADARFFA